MSEKFKSVPVDPDTRVLARRETAVGDYEALHERWSWEGIKAETLVFVSGEVESLSDEALEALVRGSPLFEGGSQITVKRSDSGFTFVNFNFRS